MLTITIIITSLTQLVLALFVLQKKLSSLTNVLFSALAIAELGWVLSNYLTITDLEIFGILVSLRLILFFVVIHNTLFYLFAKTFPGRTWIHSKKRLAIYLGFSLVIAILTLTPFVFTSAEIKDSVPISTAGPGIIAFLVHAIFSIFIAFKALFSKRKTTNPSERRQIELLIVASILIWIVVPITNFVFTPLFSTTFFIKISPVYTLLFATLIAYTIISHKLFDIKAVVARSVAYTLVLGSLAFAYGFVLFGVVNTVFGGSDNEMIRQAFSVILIVPVLLSFQSTKTYFDRITEKIFYKDSYDAQTFIDELNKKLVSNSDTEVLLKQSCQLIEDNIKSEYVSFYVRDTSYFKSRLVGDYGSKLKDDESAELHSLLPRTHTKILYVEDEPVNDAEKKAFEILRANNIDVLVRIVSTLDYEVDGVGYLLLGQKRSGNPYSKQDLRVLEIVGNELEIAVENSLRFEEIEQFNVTLQKKIEDATRELKRNNDKLRALDEAKDEFVSMASHQLRTPLTSIKGYISMVVEGDVGEVSDTQRKMLGQALFSSQRMVYLISDLLNVSRLKTGKFIIEPKPVYLPDLVQSEVEQLVEGARAKDITLKFEKPGKLTTIMLDDMKIRQVVMNFVDNAIYYTPSGGKIDVSLKETPKTIEFRVKDTGIGVPKQQIHKLFTKFYRADNARKARPDGTGLGLFMAKKVIVAQGGSVIIESVENKGSTFGFMFPKAKLLVENENKNKEEAEKKQSVTQKPENN